MATDNLSEPLLRMAQFFLIDALPRVNDVRDAYACARQLRDRGIVPSRGEERLLRQIVWAMLQIQNDEMEGELHRALSRLAALVLAVIEDDDFDVPDDRTIGSRLALESLAVRLLLAIEQTELQIGVAIGTRDLSIRGAADVEAVERQIAPENLDKALARALGGAALHLRQGDELLRKQKDPERAVRHRARFEEACTRTTHLLARLLAIPPERDPPIVRTHIVRRELKRIEVDAVGVERLSEVEQVREAARLLAWTEVDLGEAATDENRARLAAELRRAAQAGQGRGSDAPGDDDGAWLFASVESG